MSKTISFSARSIPTLLGLNPYKNSSKKVKILDKKFTPSQHGIYYENEAIDMYELFTKNKVKRNFSTKKHDVYNFITGKIDGMTTINNENIIIEVKCPMSKNQQIDMTKYYEAQMQIYMELYNIEKTHYCEYFRPSKNSHTFSYFNFRYKTIYRNKEWFSSILPLLLDIRDKSI